MNALVEDRIINGILKARGAEHTPESIRTALDVDVEIVVDERRAGVGDLWPAVWALASVLERQLTGRVFIRCGLRAPLRCPVQLGPRCEFVADKCLAAISIGLGTPPSTGAEIQIVADARCGRLAIGETLDRSIPAATAIDGFLLAGYVGYRALALITGIPSFRGDFATAQLRVDHDVGRLVELLRGEEGFSFVGLGQLGQAYLALLYFLFDGDFGGRRLVLIDKDIFGDTNGRTQILLRETDEWLNVSKAEYIESLAATWRSSPEQEKAFIDFDWRRNTRPRVAFVGMHDLEGRRMACGAGFTSIIESGVGTDLLEPRVSWHVLHGDTRRRRTLFKEQVVVTDTIEDFEWVTALKNTPGQCGWVRFNSVSATAPSLGLVAAAHSIASYASSRDSIVGRACVWSQLLPPSVEFLRDEGH